MTRTRDAIDGAALTAQPGDAMAIAAGLAAAAQQLVADAAVQLERVTVAAERAQGERSELYAALLQAATLLREWISNPGGLGDIVDRTQALLSGALPAATAGLPDARDAEYLRYVAGILRRIPDEAQLVGDRDVFRLELIADRLDIRGRDSMLGAVHE